MRTTRHKKIAHSLCYHFQKNKTAHSFGAFKYWRPRVKALVALPSSRPWHTFRDENSDNSARLQFTILLRKIHYLECRTLLMIKFFDMLILTKYVII